MHRPHCRHNIVSWQAFVLAVVPESDSPIGKMWLGMVCLQFVDMSWICVTAALLLINAREASAYPGQGSPLLGSPD